MKRKHPWFIWLSLIGLAWLCRKVLWERRSNMTGWTDDEINRWLGWCARLLGLVLGTLILPVTLAGVFIPPYSTAWDIFISLYAYWDGVFMTSYLYNWYCKK